MDARRCELHKISQKYQIPIQAQPITLADSGLSAQEQSEFKDTDNVGLKVNLQDTGKQFLSGSATLTPQARAYFTDIAKSYSPEFTNAKDKKQHAMAFQRKILIIGHTDDVGDSNANAVLAQKRAKEVANVFAAQGVPKANLHYQGAGETQPRADNRTEEGRNKNRRAELKRQLAEAKKMPNAFYTEKQHLKKRQPAKRRLIAGLVTSLMLMSSQAFGVASLVNLPSCTTVAKLPQTAPHTLLSVMIDQTTLVDSNLMAKFAHVAEQALRPNSEVRVYTFSAFSQGQYFTQTFRGQLDGALSDDVRYTLPKKTLKTYEQCVAQQRPAVSHHLQKTLDTAMTGARADLAKSDILDSLKQAAETLKQSSASSKNLLIFSDMLENSAITSFYARNTVRTIDVQKEINLIEKANLFADFGGTNVYVMGAGLVSEAGHSKGVYRDPKTLQALNLFWQEWFKRSNAQLIEFGTPELKQAVQTKAIQ